VHTPNNLFVEEDRKTVDTGACSVSMSNILCSEYVKGYNAGYSSTCGKIPDGRNNILTAVSPDPSMGLNGQEQVLGFRD
jgi:hypothetical protein